MWFYNYLCEVNGRVVEVRHPAQTRLKTWGEVCRWAGIDPGDTPPETEVFRLIADGMPIVFRLKNLDKDAPSHKLDV